MMLRFSPSCSLMRKKSPELEKALRMALNGMDFEKAWKKCGRPGANGVHDSLSLIRAFASRAQRSLWRSTSADNGLLGLTA